MRRQKMLAVGSSGSIRWSRGGHETESIGYVVEEQALRLIYRTRSPGGEWCNVDEHIPFALTNTNFGGQRQWFVCLGCHRRCRVIYGGARYRCRQCQDLKYESQYETSFARGTNERHRLRKRLGHAGPLSDPFPVKPKGMHRKTYEKLRARDSELDQRSAANLLSWLERNDPRQ